MNPPPPAKPYGKPQPRPAKPYGSPPSPTKGPLRGKLLPSNRPQPRSGDEVRGAPQAAAPARGTWLPPPPLPLPLAPPLGICKCRRRAANGAGAGHVGGRAGRGPRRSVGPGRRRRAEQRGGRAGRARLAMPILLFLIDTSASMNQRASLGTSYLDVAKGAVEIFMKVSTPPLARPPPPGRPGPTLTPPPSPLTAARPGPGQPRRPLHAGDLRRAALRHQGTAGTWRTFCFCMWEVRAPPTWRREAPPPPRGGARTAGPAPRPASPRPHRQLTVGLG